MITQKGLQFTSRAFGKWLRVLPLFPAFISCGILQKPVIFLGFYAALMPLDSLFAGASIGALTKYLGGIAALAMLGNQAFFHRGKVMRPPSATWWWMAFLIWILTSSLWAIDPSKIFASHIVIRTFELFALYFFVSLYSFTLKDVIWLKILVVLGGVVASLYSFSLALQGITWENYGRLTILGAQGREVDPNYWAATLLIPFLFSLEWLLSTKNARKRLLAAMASVIILSSIISSGSRGVLLGTVIAILVFLWEKRAWLSGKPVIPVIVVMATAVFVFYSLAPNILGRYTAENIIMTHGARRFIIWKLGGIAFTGSPLYGFGYNNFSVATNRYLAQVKGGHVAKGLSSHNIYIQSIVELGTIGFILLLIVLWKHWRLLQALKRSGNRLVPILEATFVGMLVIGATLETLDQKSFWLAFTLIVMAVNVQRGISESGEESRDSIGMMSNNELPRRKRTGYQEAL